MYSFIVFIALTALALRVGALVPSLHFRCCK